MGTMMIIPPLDACVPAKKKWPWEGLLGPESGKSMNYFATWGNEIFCVEVMAAISKDKYWFKPNDIYIWTLTQNSDWVDASVFWAPTRANDYRIRLLPSQPYQSAFPCQLLLAWNHTARRVVRLLVSFPFCTSPGWQQLAVMASCHSNNYGNLYSPISAC